LRGLSPPPSPLSKESLRVATPKQLAMTALDSVRDLGIEVDDALEMSEQTDL